MNVKELLDYGLNETDHISNKLSRSFVLRYLNTTYRLVCNSIIGADENFFNTEKTIDLVADENQYTTDISNIQKVEIDDEQVEWSYFGYNKIELASTPTESETAGLKITYQSNNKDLRFANGTVTAVADNGDGTVGIPVDFLGKVAVDDEIIIEGTTNYDGNYTVVSLTGNFVNITETYNAETLAITSIMYGVESSVNLPVQYHDILWVGMIPLIYQHFGEITDFEKFNTIFQSVLNNLLATITKSGSLDIVGGDGIVSECQPDLSSMS